MVGKEGAGDLVVWAHRTVGAMAFWVSPKVRLQQPDEL